MVWDWSKLDDTYLKKYGVKITAIICLLNVEKNIVGESTFSLNKLISKCGLKVDSHKGKSLDIFKELLQKLITDGILINTNIDIAKAKPNDYIECVCNINLDVENDKNTNFFILKYKDLISIINSKKSVIDNINLYSYILARKGNRDGDIINNITVTGGKAEVFYDSYEKISDDLNISKTKLSKCLNELVGLDLIKYGNIGLVTKDRKVITANNVYAISESELEYGLECSLKWYEKQGYKLVKK